MVKWQERNAKRRIPLPIHEVCYVVVDQADTARSISFRFFDVHEWLVAFGPGIAIALIAIDERGHAHDLFGCWERSKKGKKC